MGSVRYLYNLWEFSLLILKVRLSPWPIYEIGRQQQGFPGEIFEILNFVRRRLNYKLRVLSESTEECVLASFSLFATNITIIVLRGRTPLACVFPFLQGQFEFSSFSFVQVVSFNNRVIIIIIIKLKSKNIKCVFHIGFIRYFSLYKQVSSM